MELIAVVAAARPGRGRPLQPAPARRGHPPLPEGRAQGQGAADARHPARALGLLHRDDAAAQWLKEPDVGLALDPEWRMDAGPGARAGDRPRRRARGQRDVGVAVAARRRATSCRRSSCSIHQFTDDMVDDTAAQGARGARDACSTSTASARGAQDRQVQELHRRRRGASGAGFKLFYQEDTNLMTAAAGAAAAAAARTSSSTSEAAGSVPRRARRRDGGGEVGLGARVVRARPDRLLGPAARGRRRAASATSARAATRSSCST